MLNTVFKFYLCYEQYKLKGLFGVLSPLLYFTITVTCYMYLISLKGYNVLVNCLLNIHHEYLLTNNCPYC